MIDCSWLIGGKNPLFLLGLCGRVFFTPWFIACPAGPDSAYTISTNSITINHQPPLGTLRALRERLFSPARRGFSRGTRDVVADVISAKMLSVVDFFLSLTTEDTEYTEAILRVRMAAGALKLTSPLSL